MPKDFISVVQDLEDLLCHHITASIAEDFVDELVGILKAVLNIDRNTHWSIQSFLYDLRDEYYRLHLTSEQPQRSRPPDDIWPRLNRSVVEPLSTMPMTHDIGPDMPSFAIRYADQVYNVLRLQAKMPYKPFIEVLTENGFVKGPSSSSSSATTNARKAQDEPDDAVMHDCAPVDAGSGSTVGEHAQEYDAGLLSRLAFLEDRVVILERREELLEGQLDRATQAMGALRSTNLDLARKVSEVQQRNHDLRRTYAV
ncbi:uncharacterized protein TRIREDRAFT_110987 [Trichoderma reesei QM6a]|uniref:Predicted protein n=2 Tax=Hypocrea jecorina TaxID=51453 RepID=G0RTG8_HYPJQ|nr:uncharacterized protein TRIREDRAFT_110987 [Trichoderma reesei QM6a]EGR45564.1 predicted protein [Trichoderma reesei QM6a]ETR98725.1 hypothetical protein M419DRAFT_87875 [Trichoderma reesei RUT C-30]